MSQKRKRSSEDKSVDESEPSASDVNTDGRKKLFTNTDREPNQLMTNTEGGGSTQESTEHEDEESLSLKQVKTGQNKYTSFAYITNTRSLRVAMKGIESLVRNKQMLAVDCEGVELSRFGSLTILSIGTRDTVYLIDVKEIGESVFDDGLRRILEDTNTEKLMFDCREDADALLHNHKVKLAGVLDIQLLEVKPMIRFYGYTKIKSLKHCLELYTVNDPTLFNIKVNGRSNMDAKGEIWGRRPLKEELLEYAVVDVVALFTLYDKLKNNMPHQRWQEVSQRYCDKDRSRYRSHRDGSNRLPSGIF